MPPADSSHDISSDRDNTARTVIKHMVMGQDVHCGLLSLSKLTKLTELTELTEHCPTTTAGSNKTTRNLGM
jgi:hypothetical protein